MSYTQVEMNGEKVGLKFGYEAVKDFLLHCEGNMDDFFENDLLTLFGVADLMYCAYQNNQKLKGEALVFKVEDFEDWVVEKATIEDGIKEITSIVRMYEESRYTKLLVRQGNKVLEDEKKKTAELTLKKSKQPSLEKV